MPSLDDTHAANQKLLSENPQFKKFEQRIQGWVMDSPLASAQFAAFFRDGGSIDTAPTELLASYREQNPPVIHINPIYYPLVNFERKDTIVMEKALFAMLAHEIGHHTINSRTHPFTGTTYQANVQYRAEHEGMTVLNAFRIFDELQQRDPSYVPDFGSIGYGLSFHAGGVYNQWREHRNDQIVVNELSGIVLKTVDERTKLGLDNVPDYNNDGEHTHSERFRRDWDESEKRRRNGPAIRTNNSDEAAPETERAQRLQGGVQPPPPGASTRELFDYMCTAMETGDDRLFKHALSTVADAPGNREFWAHIAASVDADEKQAALQTQINEQALQMQQMALRGPAMSRGFSL